MNRLKNVVMNTRPAAAQAFARSLRRSPAPNSTPLTLFNPLHYEPNYAYPLFVWLHGAGADERQLPRLMPYLSMRNYVAVAPRGTIGVSAPRGRHRYRWPLAPQHVESAMHRIVDSIREARDRFNIAPHRIFLAGADDGGTLALRVALQYPDMFAGVLSAGGLLPTGGAPLARLSAARGLPVFFAWREEDEQCARGAVCRNLRLLHAAGFDVALRLYAGGQSESTEAVADPSDDAVTRLVLADMDRWMMQLVTGERTVPAPRAGNRISNES